MKTDFEKIIEVTRMAKVSAQRKRGTPGMTRRFQDYARIDSMFSHTKHRIALRWYATVVEMRQIDV